MSGIPAGAGSLLGKRLGKYEILALLALGGTAEIYLARIGGHAGFEKYVVVKCLHDHLADDMEFVKMFLDEARLAAHLDHSNIVQTFELGEHENRYYMVMEFLAGLSLAMIVRRAGERLPEGRLPVPLVLNMIAQACAGLHYAHERAINGKALNIVHRDISPQNLVVSFEGVCKVVDFGIAKAEMRETRTRSGTIKGKFAYMSPEQCVANNVDRRTDIFALGVIAHELLTGKRLFKRPSPYDTYQAVIECNVPPPSAMNRDIDPAIDPILMRAVAKDKDDRYPTAEAFGDALAGYLHHRGKGSGGGEVARFFDVSFAQEIEEHGARMRELISGREFSADTGVNWNEEEEERERQKEKARHETVDVRHGKLGASGRSNSSDEGTQDLGTGDLDIESYGRASSASLDDVIDDIGGEAGDPDDMPADRTRIEANPLDLIAELAKSAAAPKPAAKPATALPSVLPAGPARGKSAPIGAVPSGALALPDPPEVAPGASARVAAAKAPEKFPNLSNLPTMIAELDESSDVAEVPDGEMTSMKPAPPIAIADRETPYVPRRAPLPHVNDMSASEAAMAAVADMSGSSYPMMPRQPPAQQQHGDAPMGSGPYGAAPGSGPYGAAPGSGPYGAAPGSGPYGIDPAHAASLMSPVGDQYGKQVDWDAAAAMPAKALPPWLLAVLFVGGIGVALTLTIMIARMFHHH